ncbi:carboxymuconolactone decarboxylase family protein [Candidatus Poriferisodalis sp.]|uniref:carboxymuconolactone decarboxylase family protein n=1 Tax=Candidatus Poriferisodalis sp. TaxID=3101277 RepID=UPI003AF59C52
MSNVQPLKREDLPQFEEIFNMIDAHMGFLPTSLLTMGRVPEVLGGFLALGGAILQNPVVDRELKSLVSHAASAANGCRYCQAHTGATAAQQGTDPVRVAAVWEFETSDLFTPAERAALRLAFHSGSSPNAATAEDFEECRKYYSEEQIVAIVAVCALFGYLNRWNDTMATQLESEPSEFGTDHLTAVGWQIGRHA